MKVSCIKDLSIDFVEEFKDKLNWLAISCTKHSENFIRKFSDRAFWVSISFWQDLSIEFIEEFQDKIDWQMIRRNKSFIHLGNLSLREDVSKSLLEEFKHEIIGIAAKETPML